VALAPDRFFSLDTVALATIVLSVFLLVYLFFLMN